MAKYVTPTIEITDKPTGTKGSFFVRLAYGYVEHKLGMNTAKMTTDEVMREFLGAKGTKTPKEFFDKKFKGKKDEPKKEETKVQPKTEAEFKEQKKQMLDNNDNRIKYARVVTKKKLDRVLDIGQNGMGELTARLFNEDAFGIKADEDNRGGAYYNPSDNSTNFKTKNFAFDEYFDYHEEGGTFYHECWHAIDNNYSNYAEKDWYGFVTSNGNLSIDYTLSTGKTFQQTLIQEFNKIDVEEMRKDISADLDIEFKERHGITKQEAKERFLKAQAELNEYVKNGEWSKVVEYRKNTFDEIERIYNASKSNWPTPKITRKWADLSDVVNGGTSGHETLVGVGHSRDYWMLNGADKRAQECFAEIASSMATNPESYKAFQKWLPETVKAFEEIHGKLNSGELKTKGRRKYE
jgi:hypothetical protein